MLTCLPILLALLLQQPATAPTLQDLRDAARTEAERELAELRTLEATNRDGLYSVTLQNGLLSIRPKVTTNQDRASVRITDWPGLATVFVHGEGEDLQMHLIHRRFDEPQTVLSYTHIIGGPLGVQVSRDAEGVGFVRSVQFIQSTLMAGAGEAPVRLYVREINTVTGETIVDQNLPAENLDEIRREQPEIVSKYLDPVLRDLDGGRAASGASAGSAFQVIRRDLPVDPKVAEVLQKVLTDLDADDFATRRDAARALNALGQPAAVALREVDLDAYSAEVRAAIDAFLAPYLPLPIETAEKLYDDPAFLLESVAVVDADVRPAVVARLAKVLNREVAIDPNAGPADLERQIAEERRKLESSPPPER